jgi:hypothetical protein
MKSRSEGSPMKTNTDSIAVPFLVRYEVHDVVAFRKAGHQSIPALRYRDAEGNRTSTERKWVGKQAHVLTLLTPLGQIATIPDVKNKERPVAYAISDSRADAECEFREQVTAIFFNSQTALQLAGINADQARKTKEERDKLLLWMQRFAKPEDIANVLGIAEAAVAEYQRQMADPALPGKVDELLRGAV